MLEVDLKIAALAALLNICFTIAALLSGSSAYHKLEGYQSEYI